MLNKQEILIEPHVMPCSAEDSKLAHIFGHKHSHQLAEYLNEYFTFKIFFVKFRV